MLRPGVVGTPPNRSRRTKSDVVPKTDELDAALREPFNKYERAGFE